MNTSDMSPVVEPLENRLCFSVTHHLTAAGSTTLTNDDQDFMIEKQVGNITEARLGVVALNKTSNVALHALAVRLAGDHTAAYNQLNQVAAADGVTLPTSPDYKHRKIIRWMSSLNGKAFDQAFAAYMVADHHSDISDYQQEEQTTADPGLNTYTNTQLPILVRHLGLAEDGRHTAASENANGSAGPA